MIRLIVSCSWICAATAGAAFVTGTLLLEEPKSPESHKRLEGLEHRKTQPINVPMIANGKVEGYVVAQFNYVADAHELKALQVPPDVFITDEAFRILYTGTFDFRHLEKYDLAALTKALVGKVNQRLGGEIIQQILVAEFIFVPKSDVLQ